MHELSLRPYPGRLFVTINTDDYEKSYKEFIWSEDPIDSKSKNGRFCITADETGTITYLIWVNAANGFNVWSHELSHAILDLFQRIGIDPREAGGEPFCYLLERLLKDVDFLEPCR